MIQVIKNKYHTIFLSQNNYLKKIDTYSHRIASVDLGRNTKNRIKILINKRITTKVRKTVPNHPSVQCYLKKKNKKKNAVIKRKKK